MGVATQDANTALTRLCDSAGPQAQDALALLSKVLGNIADHPEEPKYKRLKPDNPKLKDGLFRYAGAADFLKLAGFSVAPDGALEFSNGGASGLQGACGLVEKRRQLLREDPVAAAYRAIVQGGGGRAGLAELEAIASAPGGEDSLRMLEKVLDNIHRYPDSERYRCVSLAKAATQKLLVAAPLMKKIGFVQETLPSGEAVMKLGRLDLDVLLRFWAMVMWAVRPAPTLELPAPGDARLDRALGAVLGAAIGDALGAPLGGKGPFEVTAAEVDKSMEMCGGGRWGVAPGQTSGLTELIVCLADALAEKPADLHALPDEDLAARYGRWGQSQPFHADRACRQAFQRPLPLAHLLERAKELNTKSMGAGALTRCAPLGVLAAAIGAPTVAADLARADAALSHPDPVVGNASAAYAVTIANLILADGDRTRALQALQEWTRMEAKAEGPGGQQQLATSGGPSGWTHLPKPQQEGKQDPKAWSPPGERTVSLEVVNDWLTKALAGDGELAFSNFDHAALLEGEVGSVDIPLKHAFRLLHAGVDFEDAMRRMLAGGGDSCTNALAVGGMLGAAVGLKGLPRRWVLAVLTSDVDSGQFRPPEIRASRLPELTQRIFARAT